MPAGSVTSSTVTLTWNPPDMPNGVITSYTVNLVATSSNAGITESGRRKRQEVAVVMECVMRNGGEVNSNRTVGGDQTSLTITNLGMCLQCICAFSSIQIGFGKQIQDNLCML